MLADLMLELSKGNLNISQQSEEFLLGLYKFLDPYDQFLNQQSEAQKKWLYDLHKEHIRGESW